MAQQTAPSTTLSRQGSVVRSDAIAKLKRAASQREVRATPLPVHTLQRSDTVKQPVLMPTDVSNDTSLSATYSIRAPTTSDGYLSPRTNDLLLPIGTPGASPSGQSNASSELLPSPNRSPLLPKDRAFNRSPLPSLEQLRARILQERETASTSTSAASQAARAYALEKLLGNSGEDVFTGYAHGASTPSPTHNHNSSEDIASDDENKSDMRTRRQSVMKRPSLRRSMSVNSLASISDTHRKASFAQSGFLDVPSPASNRISRIRQRRIERDSVVPASPPAAVPEQTAPDSDLARTQSQRQIARTQLLRKLSTRGRGLPPPRVETANAQPASAAYTHAQTPTKTANREVEEQKDVLSPLRQVPQKLPSPALSAKQSSPSLFSDEDELEDDAFYKLYSPAIGYDDEGEEEEVNVFDRSTATVVPSLPDESPAKPQTPQISKHAPTHFAEPPSTPPPTFAYRQSAAVPYDPSPGTDADLTELRRSHWMSASPSGVTVPLRFSNSLISAADGLPIDSTPPKPKSPYKARGAAGDWPVSIGSSLMHASESLQSGANGEVPRGYEESLPSNYSASPALPSSDDRYTSPRTDDADLLAVPNLRSRPSERLQAILGPGFVQEYAGDLDFDNRSKSSLVADDTSADERETRGLGVQVADTSRLSPSNAMLKDDLSDGDGEVDDDYLRKVDRIADKLRRLAKPTKVTRVPSVRKNVADARDADGSQRPSYEPAFDMATSRALPAQASPRSRQEPQLTPMSGLDRLNLGPGVAQRMREQLQDKKKAVSNDVLNRPLPDPPASYADDSGDTSHGSVRQDESDQRPSSPGKEAGLFSSLRRKASSLRRNPSSAKDKEGGFWSRRNAAAKNGDSPKLPSEPTFISAPIMTNQAPSASFAVVPSQSPAVRTVALDPTQTTDAEWADLQRNGSISSVGSARLHADLQDGTADNDTAANVDQAAAASLGPGAAAMIHRYSRMLTASSLSTPVPGVTMQHMRDPPRKFVLAEPVFQVISATTIKDRYLFLLSDLLIIAKPVASTETEANRPLGKMKEADILPSLEWKFAVKNILELHRLQVSVTSSSRTATAKTRAQNPVLWSFVRQFSQDADAAVRTLTGRTGLNASIASIAQVLYQTPELDRADLTRYLCQPNHRQLLREYVGQHRHVGVSIESALRSLLLDLRFPKELDAFEASLMNFSHSWIANNASTIKADFDAALASDLVFAIMALNDALHTNSTAGATAITSPNFPRPVMPVTPGLFSAPCHDLSKEDFVRVFRQHDPQHVLSDRTLSRIYLSIRSEPLAQALDRHEPRFTIRIKGGKLPTRMTYAQPAEPVTLVIPAPDPDLAIRLYAQDTTFEPPVLTFAHSREASFTMWSKHLGPKQVVFVRAGRNARYYAGTEADITDSTAGEGAGQDAPPLPRSFSVTVERAFMKHSFTLSSAGSGSDETKRFMFSFENGDKVALWTAHINAQIDACLKAKALMSSGSGRDSAVLKRATEAIALQVLRDTLVVHDDVQAPGTDAGSSLNRANTVTGTLLPHHFRTAAAPATELSATSSNQHGGQSAADSRLLAPTSTLDRAPSTSRHYYAASGVGRHERELLIPASTSSATMMSGSSSSGQIHSLATGATRPHHTKGSASLSVYPPSASSNAAELARANSTRATSAQRLQNTAPRPPAPSSADKNLPGTQIVSIARLNSLLSTVLAHHQSQPPVHQQQQQPPQHRYR